VMLRRRDRRFMEAAPKLGRLAARSEPLTFSLVWCSPIR
jgi:hypothetical protein